jgi:PAS domain S-box-containing protein
MLETVSVPPELEPLFREAQQFVGAYFRTLHTDPAHGTITIGGQRYILVRTASMSVEFFATITQLYRDKGETEARAVARSLLYDLAYAIGAADARAFHRELDVRDPIAKLSAGPVHFAHTGWAHVTILPESRPSADESFLLIYDHPFSFEADAWRAAGRQIDVPTCIMNAGYSAGWCTESFGLSLVAVEICCKAMGDEQCRFVMAPSERIEQALAAYLRERPALRRTASSYEIPGFFRRKQAEDELREREAQYRSIFESVTDAILIVQLDGRIATANPAAERLYGYDRAALVAMDIAQVTAPHARPLLDGDDITAFFSGSVSGETLALAADGRIFEVEFHAAAFGYRRQQHILVRLNDISERKRAEAERLRLQEQLIRQNERLREELALANTVQQALQPRGGLASTARLAIAIRSRPAGEVSRDFYTAVELEHERTLIVLGDVASKGVVAALLTALLISAIESQARATPEPAAFLSGLQARLMPQLQACNTLVSLQAVLIDGRQRRLSAANAGLPPLLLVRAGQPQLIEGGGVALGIVAQPDYAAQQIDLLPGDRVVLTSDGVPAARNAYRELFGYQRLLAALSARPATEPPEHFVEGVLATITAFVGAAEAHDDMTILAVQPVA